MSSPMGYAEMRQLAETKLRYLCDINSENLVGPKSGQNLLAFFAGLCANMEQLEKHLQEERQQLASERDTVSQKLQELESLKCDSNPKTTEPAAQSNQMDTLIDEMKQVSLSVADIKPSQADQVGAIQQLTRELQEHAANHTRRQAELAIQISELTNAAVDQKDKDRRKINRLRSMQADAEATIDDITDINKDLADRYELEKDHHRRTFDRLAKELDDSDNERKRLRVELEAIHDRVRDLSPRPRLGDQSQGKRRSRPEL